MLTYRNLKDHLDTDNLARFLETEQKVETDLVLHSCNIVRLMLDIFS